MSQNLAIDLLTLGGLLTVSCVALLNAHPEVGQVTLIGGAIGGAVCLALGVQAMIGKGNRMLTGATLILLSILGAVRFGLAVIRFSEGLVPPMEPIWCGVFVMFTSYLAVAMIREGK